MLGKWLGFFNLSEFSQQKNYQNFPNSEFWTKINYEMFKSKGEEQKVSASESCKKWCFSKFDCLLWHWTLLGLINSVALVDGVDFLEC